MPQIMEIIVLDYCRYYANSRNVLKNCYFPNTAYMYNKRKILMVDVHVTKLGY